MEDEFPPLPNANNGIQPAISGQEKNISTAVKNKEIQQADIQMNKRSRSSPSGSTNKRKQATLSDYWLAAPDTNRSNRFDILSEDGDDEVSAEYTLPAVKPPPIYVSMVENVQPLINLLNSVAKDEFEIKIIKNIEVKIQPKTEIAYSNITIEKNTQFHTFKLLQGLYGIQRPSAENIPYPQEKNTQYTNFFDKREPGNILCSKC